MITIEGTDRIKGVLTLASINQQLVKGQTLYLRDDDFWQSDVQTAKKMGWIVSKGAPTAAESYQASGGTGDRMITCVNNYHRPISVSQNSKEIRPGQTFVLSEKDMDTPAIRTAVSKKMIVPLGVANGDNDGSSEGRVYVKKRLEGVALTEEVLPPLPGDTFDEVQDKEGVVKVSLDTNEELSAPTVIKDDRGIVWNKTVEVAGPSDAYDELPTSVNPNDGDPKRSSVIVDPNKTRLNSYISQKEQNITFVDQTYLKEKIAAHPKLKNKPVQEDEGTVLITDLDNDEARIAAHPVLSKKAVAIDDFDL